MNFNLIEKRTQRIAESFLDNEALTADLDDEAAQVLIAWGMALAGKIARETAGMNDQQAEEVMYRPLRSLRRLLSTTSKLAASPDINQLNKFLERAGETYGQAFVLPSGPAEGAHFLSRLPHEPKERVAWLRDHIEGRLNQG